MLPSGLYDPKQALNKHVIKELIRESKIWCRSNSLGEIRC
jgi:hypothetical protein